MFSLLTREGALCPRNANRYLGLLNSKQLWYPSAESVKFACKRYDYDQYKKRDINGLACLFFIVIFLSLNAAVAVAESKFEKPAGLYKRLPVSNSNKNEKYFESQMLQLATHENERRLSIPEGERVLSSNQQPITTNMESWTDAGDQPGFLYNEENDLSHLLLEGAVSSERQWKSEAPPSFDIQGPMCATLGSEGFCKEDMLIKSADNETGKLRGERTSGETSVLSLLPGDSVFPPPSSSSNATSAEVESQDYVPANMPQNRLQGTIVSSKVDEAQAASFRRMQRFDPSQFGPAAQYAQYLTTFMPPTEQQNQLQMLQQAMAAGLGGNTAAMKRLQRRAQAAAYANSVSSHPLVQGVVRTAYTALADVLGRVSIADILQGAMGGAFLLPVPPMV